MLRSDIAHNQGSGDCSQHCCNLYDRGPVAGPYNTVQFRNAFLEYFVVAPLRRIHVDAIHHDPLSVVWSVLLNIDAKKLKVGSDYAQCPPGRIPTAPEMNPLAHREQYPGYRRYGLWHQRSISLVPMPETGRLGDMRILKRQY